MFNSGIRGRRARDGEGSIAVNDLYVQKISPVASVSRIAILDGSGNTIDDTALDTAGGQTILVVGGGFEVGATVTVGGTSVSPVTRLDSTRITFTSPAKSSGSHALVVNNTNGSSAIFVPGLVYSGTPTFVTSAGSLGNVYETTAINTTISATSDSAISYSVIAGNLPPGSSLSSAGVLSGTAPVEAASTTYTFTVKATDAELQDSTREFSITINSDVVTWQYHQDQQTVLIEDTNPTITLDAVSAAGYSVGYAASALPTGLTLTDGVITGTVSEETDTAATLTATANTTGRSSAISITWRVSLADSFFKLTGLLLNADRDTWITDSSTNGFELTPFGDARPSAFSPFNINWSNYFDGNGDYLTTPIDAALGMGTGDFTIECFYYHISRANTDGILCPSTNNFNITIFTTGVLGYWDGSNVHNSSQTVPLNVWGHICATRTSGTVKMYYNGIEVLSRTDTNDLATAFWFIGTNSSASTDPAHGYISNVRIVKGTAVYTSAFTPPTSPLTAISGTSLLTCQSNRFVDNSPNAFAITRTNDVIVTSFGPFTETDTATGSGYFDGTGDYLNRPQNSAFDFGTGDFTMEAYVYPTSVSIDTILQYGNASVSGYQHISWSMYLNSINSQCIPEFEMSNGSSTHVKLSSGTAILINSWNHVAVVRQGSSFNLYLNGVSVSSKSSTAAFYIPSSPLLWIGRNHDAGTGDFGGYISNARIIKGTALYTSDFTPPTAPLTPVANTQLLTLQNRTAHNNNTFLDESGNKFNITRSGNTSQGTFSPFSPSGWSAYFDENLDYLRIPYNASAFNLNTDDWTIECWIYKTNDTTAQYTQRIIEKYDYVSGTDYGWSLGCYRTSPATRLSFGWWTNLGVREISTTNAFSLHEWHHIAVAKSGSNLSLYLDGNRIGTLSNVSGATETLQRDVTIGASILETGNTEFGGYISNVRIVKGTSIYDPTLSNITVPTYPLSAVTNTVFLTCRSNRFEDEGPNRFTITRVGDTKITPFSPFAPHTVTPDTYSVYFDGNGDSLSVPGTTEFQFGTGDFTVEAFVYLNSVSTGDAQYFAATYDGANGGWAFYSPSGSTSLAFRNGDAGIVTRSYTFSSGTWYHLAVLRSSSTLKFFVDGTQIGSDENSYTQNITRNNSNGLSIGRYGTSINQFGAYVNGYVSNLRVIKGTAVTPPSGGPTSPLTAVSGTQLLTCQSLTITDNSPNAFSITGNGNSQPTKFNPFGETVTTGVEYSPTVHGGSSYHDGSGDYLTIPANSALAFGTGDFTIEFWMSSTVFSRDPYDRRIIRCIANPSTGAGAGFGLALNGDPSGGIGQLGGGTEGFGTAGLNTNPRTVCDSGWHHIVFGRKSSFLYLFLDGTLQGSVSNSDNITNPSTVNTHIGWFGTAQGFYNGYLSNFKITRGTFTYPTSNFVPPLTYTNTRNVSSVDLNFTSAGISDSASRNVLETVGDVKIVNTVKKYGKGSIKFDGTDDKLVLPSVPHLTLGNSDFTIECWTYLLAHNDRTIIGSTTTAGGIFIFADALPGRRIYINSGSTYALQVTGAFPTSTWFHLAVTKQNGTIRLFQDGALIGSVSNTTAITAPFSIGSGIYNNLNGYLDDLRITVGHARYTANFTPPDAPFKTR